MLMHAVWKQYFIKLYNAVLALEVLCFQQNTYTSQKTCLHAELHCISPKAVFKIPTKISAEQLLSRQEKLILDY